MPDKPSITLVKEKSIKLVNECGEPRLKREPTMFGVKVSSTEPIDLQSILDDTTDDCIFDSTTEDIHVLISDMLKKLCNQEYDIPAAGYKSNQEKSINEGKPCKMLYDGSLQIEPINVLKTMTDGTLSVSQISSQYWCEQQLLYTLMFPYIEDERGNIKAVGDKKHINRGTDLHENRELEVHTLVGVKCVTREDRYAVKLINMITNFQHLLANIVIKNKCSIREVPIFGEPFNIGLFFRGIIDEITYDPQIGYQLNVVEFKTRSKRTLPSKAQSFTHQIQVNIYRQLLNDLIENKISESRYLEKFQLNKNIPIGDDVLNHCKSIGASLSALYQTLLKLLKLLPPVKDGWIEFVFQDGGDYMKGSHVTFNESELKDLLKNAGGFWLGNRKCKGVDIEEAWKCGNCDYYDACDWRSIQSKKLKLRIRR
ncbi:hypothetical protein GJ496_000539 [Pomphorhynchus laevis]|nr:hypothetical protein GJ496_000539 [Pomphorhynchus laevis]